MSAEGRVDLTVKVSGFRSDSGVMQFCLAPATARFPKCAGVGVVSGSEKIAGREATIVLRDLSPGSYAVAVYHDQNHNGRLDTVVGIPREGYGFSRNPPFMPRAPRFAEASLTLSQNTQAAIRMRYIF